MTEQADVCIVGGGASGAVAAKVLTEAGMRVVCLERGPWLKPQDFAADEIGTINRNFLRPDPALNPRTLRSCVHETAETTYFCPVPQMVGGGTVHWTGLVPRFQRSDFQQATLHGDISGASLADWPICYEDLEPYYTAVEWTLGVSGEAGANRHEELRSRDYPCPPLPTPPYTRIFRRGCDRIGLSSFPTPIAVLSQPHAGRPRTVLHSFIERHGDPTGSKSTALNTFIPAALATDRLELRPGSYVRELVRDASGKVRTAVYDDDAGQTLEQSADVFVLACGGIETARLWKLSSLPDTNDLVGRNLTLHEFGGAIALFDEPTKGWVGGGHISASTLDFYETDETRGFIGGCHVFSAGARSPWPVNFTLPKRPLWGAGMKEADRTAFNHVMGVALLLHDLPQHDNRVDLDPEVRDAWGLPVARITHRPHPNDLKQAQWFVDRCADIAEAAGARTVWKFSIDKITGNASHQHGTTRMGDDPATSVLNRWCAAHEVPNLYVADGSSFPTAAGINPTLTIMANSWRVAEHIAMGCTS